MLLWARLGVLRTLSFSLFFMVFSGGESPDTRHGRRLLADEASFGLEQLDRRAGEVVSDGATVG